MTEKQLPSSHLADLAQEAADILAEGIPENTKRTYRTQWRLFREWCMMHDQSCLPARSETLVLYLTERSRTVKVSSLRVALAAITVAHREAGLTDWKATDLQNVRVFLRSLSRKKGTRTQPKKALLFEELCEGLPEGDDLKAVRDRAILLLGFFSAMRRSEISDLDWEDVEWKKDGFVLHIRQSKTDKLSEGQTVPVPKLEGDTCPLEALELWLKISESGGSGPLFTSLKSGSRLSAEAIARVVKQAAERAGFDPKLYGGHSLRSGFVTTAAQADVEERSIMRITRHSSVKTVRRYMQEGTDIAKHPAHKILGDKK